MYKHMLSNNTVISDIVDYSDPEAYDNDVPNENVLIGDLKKMDLSSGNDDVDDNDKKETNNILFIKWFDKLAYVMEFMIVLLSSKTIIYNYAKETGDIETAVYVSLILSFIIFLTLLIFRGIILLFSRYCCGCCGRCDRVHVDNYNGKKNVFKTRYFIHFFFIFIIMIICIISLFFSITTCKYDERCNIRQIVSQKIKNGVIYN